MDYIIEGTKTAIRIIFSLDSELIDVVLRSLLVSLTATVLAALVAVPVFLFLGLKKFRGESLISRLLSTFMSTPTVVVGLVVLLLLARRGPFGGLNLLYSIRAMVIAQFILIFPLIAALTFEFSKQTGRSVKNLAYTLGAGRLRTTGLLIVECKDAIFIHVITAFSRAISEVGAVMMVGGNIKGMTNVMTTTISRYNSMGEYELAIALGIILLLVSCVINWVSWSFKEKGAKHGG